MVSRLEKSLGVIERTSAEVAEGPWYPGLQTQLGSLFAGTFDGVRAAAFEVAPGRVLLTIGSENIVSVRKVASGLNMILDVDLRGPDGTQATLSFVAPRGRLKRIFEFIGFPL